MKIDRQGESLLLEVANENGEFSNFYYELKGIPIHFVEKTKIAYVFALRDDEQAANDLRLIKYLAQVHKVEITESADALFEEYARKLDEIVKAREEEREKKHARNIAITRLKNGCGLCEHIEWIGGKGFCKYANVFCRVDSEETERLFEEWKLTKTYRRSTPFPVKQCKYLEDIKGVKND